MASTQEPEHVEAPTKTTIAQAAEDRLFKMNPHFQEQIIHRSSYGIIVANKKPVAEKVSPLKKRRIGQGRFDPPVRDTNGEPENILPVVEGVKYQIPHSQEL
jgi:hypothetical protein